MDIKYIEHIGFAVRNLDEAIPFYEQLLGTTCYAIEEVRDQRVRTAFFKVGQTKIELLESVDPGGPVGKFLEKRGEGFHHIAFAVDQVDKSLEEARAMGLDLIDRKSRPGAEGLHIGFLHPRSTHGVLTEFCGKE